jgi:hypothetical protein
MHDWSNKEVDWRGISDAAEFIAHYLTARKVMVMDHKEKWGTVRVSVHFGLQRGWLLNHLFYPNYHYYQFPRWARDLDYLLPIDWLNPLVIPIQQYWYRRAYQLALKKWPLLREEILSGADWSELLVGLGIQRVRTGERCYEVHVEWHSDNYSVRNAKVSESSTEES